MVTHVADRSARPVFVIGGPFSGCNVLMWALAQHPAIAALPESGWLNLLSTTLESVFSMETVSGGGTQLGQLGINRGQMYRPIGEAVHTMLSATHGGEGIGNRRWVAAGAECGRYAFGLWQMFPEARFIHLVRDVQEVVHSLTNFCRVAGIEQTEHEAYRAWLEDVDACVRTERAFGSDVVLRVRYRDLVDDPTGAMHRCLQFIGESPSKDQLLWPLQLLCSEPRLGDTYHVADRDLRERAKRLSRDLAKEGEPRYHKNQDSILALKASFLERCARRQSSPGSVTQRIRDVAALYLPPRAEVAVVSRGDDALLELGDCRGTHFPQDADGVYAGYHPADTADVVARLEALRVGGAEYLLIPESSFWWLDHYEGLATFLGDTYPIVAFVEEACLLFALVPVHGHSLCFVPSERKFESAAARSGLTASKGRTQLLEPGNERAFMPGPFPPTPRDPMRLPGSIWAITCFFNPHDYRNKYRNYRLFREALRRAGIPLLTSELAFGSTSHVLTDDDADVLIQLRTADVLWHKERLLNLSLDRLPDGCDKVVWIDCDVLLQNTQWVTETAALLEEHRVVQPFSHCVRLGPGETSCNPAMLPFGHREDELFYGLAFGVAAYGREALANFFHHGHTGFAWAIRRDVLAKHGLFEHNLLANGDTDVGHAMYGNGDYWSKKKLGPKVQAHLERWAEPFHEDVRSSVGFVGGALLHLWHGDVKDRLYDKSIAVMEGFDPDTDLSADPATGLYGWAQANPELREWSRTYFGRRREEDPRKFFVVCPARSGSTLLMSALESHPDVERTLMEPFNTEDPDLARELAPVMREVYGKDVLAKTTDDLKRLIDHLLDRYDGFKILYYQVGLGDAAWEYLRSKRLKVVHLTRRNDLERQISFLVAQQTSVWHRQHESECPPEPQVTLDAATLENSFAFNHRLFEHFETFFQLADKLTIDYEDLRDDYSATMKRVYEFLQLPVTDCPPAYLKRTRKTKVELVANYHELKAHFSGSPWAHYFDE